MYGVWPSHSSKQIYFHISILGQVHTFFCSQSGVFYIFLFAFHPFHRWLFALQVCILFIEFNHLHQVFVLTTWVIKSIAFAVTFLFIARAKISHAVIFLRLWFDCNSSKVLSLLRDTTNQRAIVALKYWDILKAFPSIDSLRERLMRILSLSIHGYQFQASRRRLCTDGIRALNILWVFKRECEW